MLTECNTTEHLTEIQNYRVAEVSLSIGCPRQRLAAEGFHQCFNSPRRGPGRRRRGPKLRCRGLRLRRLLLGRRRRARRQRPCQKRRCSRGRLFSRPPTRSGIEQLGHRRRSRLCRRHLVVGVPRATTRLGPDGAAAAQGRHRGRPILEPGVLAASARSRGPGPETLGVPAQALERGVGRVGEGAGASNLGLRNHGGVPGGLGGGGPHLLGGSGAAEGHEDGVRSSNDLELEVGPLLQAVLLGEQLVNGDGGLEEGAPVHAGEGKLAQRRVLLRLLPPQLLPRQEGLRSLDVGHLEDVLHQQRPHRVLVRSLQRRVELRERLPLALQAPLALLLGSLLQVPGAGNAPLPLLLRILQEPLPRHEFLAIPATHDLFADGIALLFVHRPDELVLLPSQLLKLHIHFRHDPLRLLELVRLSKLLQGSGSRVQKFAILLETGGFGARSAGDDGVPVRQLDGSAQTVLRLLSAAFLMVPSGLLLQLLEQRLRVVQHLPGRGAQLLGARQQGLGGGQGPPQRLRVARLDGLLEGAEGLVEFAQLRLRGGHCCGLHARALGLGDGTPEAVDIL
mmetsp:Transcript_66971/g.217976  ORF Transcript_66971/g.217976 Transcript_66971/m.217976 type:complete len:565 (-) Transcript_66971:2374-4068(-)